MARGRRGRPRADGARYPNGQLRPTKDLGNERVRAHRALFDGGGAGADLDCAVGIAFATGLLDGLAIEGRVLMEHGREYYRLHRHALGGALRVRTQSWERRERGVANIATNAADRSWRRWSAVVARLTPFERATLDLVCIDHGEGWALPPFLDRFVSSWLARRGLRAAGEAPGAEDRRRLEALRSALLALSRPSFSSAAKKSA